MTEIQESLQALLLSKAARIVKVDQTSVSWDADIDEFGFGSMEVNQMCLELNEYFSISIHPGLFLEVTSLEALSQYLLDKFPAAVEQRCA
jgi:hypothetical protein